MTIRVYLLVSFLLFAVCTQAQTDLAVEFQIYPTGFLPGISIDHSLSGKSVLYGRVGANLFDHRDLGVQDEEEGAGLGFSLGYKNYFKEGRIGWRWGIKNDIWRNTVDWQTGTDTGETKIWVVQPTAELSYVFRKTHYFIAPSAALGFEWNVETDGEPTGEGAILLLGVQIGFEL
ncbi:MAG: hypothetical protein AAGA10_29500 [Bacteroidota bacterium]